MDYNSCENNSDFDDQLSDDQLSDDEFNNIDIINNYKDILERYNINKNSCNHSKNKYKIYCDICNKDYNCWKCHNKTCTEHRIEQRDVTKLVCCECNTIQKFNNKCEKCNNIFGAYICIQCKIIDNTYKYKHCNKCGYCMDIYNYQEHTCIENLVDDNCPVCLEKLINNGKIKKMMCNHFIHESCYNNLILNSDKCPLCVKTVHINADKINILNNKLLKSKCNSKKYINIYCRDCEKKFNIKYNDIALKCPKCKLFNCV